VADTTSFTDSNHHTIQGGTTVQRGEMREIYLAGQAAASAPQIACFGRTSTVGATLTALRMAALDPSTEALGTNATAFAVSTTKPGRSNTLGMLVGCGFNAFGGIVRWTNGPDQIISYLGKAASFGELSLNFFTGNATASIQSTLMFETL